MATETINRISETTNGKPQSKPRSKPRSKPAKAAPKTLLQVSEQFGSKPVVSVVLIDEHGKGSASVAGRPAGHGPKELAKMIGDAPAVAFSFPIGDSYLSDGNKPAPTAKLSDVVPGSRLVPFIASTVRPVV